MPPACPIPVYAADTRLAGLTTAELLLVGTLRQFALPSPARCRDDAGWSGGLVAAGIGVRAVHAFHRFFAVVAAAALRPLAVHRPNCAILGEDEARLLQLVSLLQRQRRAGAGAILADWMPATAVRMAMAPACVLAAGLAEAHLVVPLRHAEAAAIAQAAPHGDRGLLLVQ